MRKIRKNDEVVVIAGKDKNKRGTVLKLIAENRVIVEGLNMVKKHVKPNPQKNVQGGILERESAMDVSNVAIWNPMTSKADRVGIKVLEDGRKVRFFKSNEEVIDVIES